MRPWGTTVLTLGAVAYGVYSKNASSNSYDKYHAATSQSEINKYYEQANEENLEGNLFLGLGAALWVSDIVWTIVKGTKNKSEQRRINKRYKIQFQPSVSPDGVNASLTLKF